MTDTEHDRFKTTYKKERDPRVRSRILAVHMVCVLEKNVEETAKLTMQCPEWVTKWVQRYREGGIDTLADLPRPRRPTAIPQCGMDCIMKDAQQNKTAPVMLQQKIQQDYRVSYHITHVRNIMSKLSNLVRKRSWENKANRYKSDYYHLLVFFLCLFSYRHCPLCEY